MKSKSTSSLPPDLLSLVDPSSRGAAPALASPATGADAAAGASTVDVSGATVGEALEALFAQHGELRERLCDEGGELRRFVNVYVGGEDIRFGDGLSTPVANRDEITVLPAVAGG